RRTGPSSFASSSNGRPSHSSNGGTPLGCRRSLVQPPSLCSYPVPMRRREFLSGVLAAPAFAAIEPASSRQASTTAARLKLGIVTYLIGKDWDVPTIIKNLTECQYDAVELRTTHRHGVEITLTPAERLAVRKRFDASPVKIGGLGTTCEFH